MIFRQMQDSETGTYTYLIADRTTRSALFIDPVLEQWERDQKILKELDLNIKYILETHIHADHITSAYLFRENWGAKVLTGVGSDLKCADILLEDGQKFKMDSIEFQALATPGHTDGCTSYYFGDRVFTGDALLIRGCGRTDFQQGSSERLFKSIREKIFKLPDETLVFPAHDYKGWSCSSVAEEKKHNPRLKLDMSLDQFSSIMANLNLPPPKKIEASVPRNQNCGKP